MALAAICVATFGPGAGTTEAAAFRVVLGTSPNQPKEDITITLPSSATATTIPVFLRNDGRKPVRNLRIYATATYAAVRAPGAGTTSTSECVGPEADEPGTLHRGEEVSESGLTIAFPIADTNGRLAIPPKAEITGTLTLLGLTSPGTYVAEIHAEKDAKHQQLLAQVKIVKRPALQFTLEGAGATGLQATSRTSLFEGNYDLISGSPLPSEVTIELGGINGPDNQQIDPVLLIDGVGLTGPACIGPFGRANLNIKLDTPLTGDYLSSLQVVAANPTGDSDHIAFSVKVNRIRPTTSVESEGGLVSPVEMWWATNADVSVFLRETEGREVHLNSPPSLFIYRAKDAAKYGADVQLRSIVPTPGDQAGSAASTSQAVAGETVPSIVVPPHGSTTLVASVGEIPEPGQYHGTLRFDVLDGTAVTQEFTIVARRNWLLAAALILSGVIIGEILRQVVNRRLPRLQLRSKIEKLARRLAVMREQPGLSASARQDLSEMQGRLANAARETLGDEWEGAKDDVEAVARQADAFPTWLIIKPLFGRVIDKAPFQVRMDALTTAMHIETLRQVDKDALAGASDLRTALEGAPKQQVVAAAALGGAPPVVPQRRLGFSVGTQLKIGRGVIWTVLILAATLIGLQALWATNATWGTFPDYAAALLWGLGAWAAVGPPFGGTGTLLKTINAPAP